MTTVDAQATEPADAVPADPAALSTQPRPDRPGPRAGLLPTVRTGWRRLTSMRTALVLLFLLALAAVPGSLLPQRGLNPIKVDRYLAEHPTLGPLLSRLGFFDVFASPWFAAVYLLLLISLVGCLTPRIRLHARALRAVPPATPRRLERLPQHDRYAAAGPPAQVAESARRGLSGWRTVVREEPDGVLTVAAERGYLRETGNLVFHVALTVLLLGVAAGKLWGYSGTVLVEEGRGFCNSATLFDAFHPGRLVDGRSLAPFCVDSLDRFTASYDAAGVPTSFQGDITYSLGADGAPRTYPLRVNSPLRVEGVRLYLLSHGFSPVFTVHTAGGQDFRGVSAPFLPTEPTTLASEGVLKLPDVRPGADGRPRQLALSGLFLPTAVDGGGGVLTSVAPNPGHPAVALFVYRGDLGLDSGAPQSVYALDQTQVTNGALTRVARANLYPGQSTTLDDGTTITFDGYRQWATMLVSRDPGQRLVLGSAVAIVLGLLLSLSVRRRRFWLRVTPTGRDGTAGRSIVEVGGLARADGGSFPAEFGRLVEKLRGTPSPCRED